MEAKDVDGLRQYLVSWDGFDSDHDTWEPANNLHPELVAEYDKEHEFEICRLAKIRSNQQYLHDVFADVEVTRAWVVISSGDCV